MARGLNAKGGWKNRAKKDAINKLPELAVSHVATLSEKIIRGRASRMPANTAGGEAKARQ